MSLDQPMTNETTQNQTPWQDYLVRCESCRACALGYERKNAVVYRGSIRAPLMIIGEGPGQNEDEQGVPFVGRSGQLLDQLLTAWGFPQDSYHIANIVKCRPPNNRQPTVEEARACRPLLNEQFKFVRPRVVLLMGGAAYKYFTGDMHQGITKTRGEWIEQPGLSILPTYHPAYILRSQSKRPDLWDDIGMIRERLESLELLPPLKLNPEAD